MKAISIKQVAIPLHRISINENGCWEWQGAKSSEGYGLMTVKGQVEYVHRLAFQLFIQPVGKDRELDHLCRNRKCCNPTHLEAVSSRENSLRGNHPLFTAHRERRCLKGHDLSNPGNIHRRKDGRARCKICSAQYQKDRRNKLKCVL